MKDWLEENSKRGRVLGLCPGNLQRRVGVQNPQEIHLDRVLIQLVHLRLLGHHEHLGSVFHRLALLPKEGLCQKDVFTVISFIQGLVAYHKGYVFIVDSQDISNRIV